MCGVLSKGLLPASTLLSNRASKTSFRLSAWLLQIFLRSQHAGAQKYIPSRTENDNRRSAKGQLLKVKPSSFVFIQLFLALFAFFFNSEESYA